MSLKVNVGEQSNPDVSKLDDFKILHNPTVYGSFMQLVGIDNKLVDLEILKSPQVVASYVRFTDINICTTVTDPLPSQKCSELASEPKVEKSDQTKDDSSIKKGFKHIAGDDMEKFLSKKAKKKTLEKDKGADHVSFAPESPVTRSSSANLKDLAPSKRVAIQKANAMLKCTKKLANKIQEQMNILQRCILDDEGADNSFFHCMSVLYPEIGAATPEEFKSKVTSYIAKTADEFSKVSVD